ncbi:MAG: hypothetical protein K9L75_06625 [Spirochaetia bacterium]|nr:hypothetical protein [Spirochaetia bacterium]
MAEVKANLHERYIPDVEDNRNTPAEDQICVELEHLTAREMAECEYILQEEGIYRRMYDYKRIAKKIHTISNFTSHGEEIDTGEKLVSCTGSRKAVMLLKDITHHLLYEGMDEDEEKN